MNLEDASTLLKTTRGAQRKLLELYSKELLTDDQFSTELTSLKQSEKNARQTWLYHLYATASEDGEKPIISEASSDLEMNETGTRFQDDPILSPATERHLAFHLKIGAFLSPTKYRQDALEFMQERFYSDMVKFGNGRAIRNLMTDNFRSILSCAKECCRRTYEKLLKLSGS